MLIRDFGPFVCNVSVNLYGILILLRFWIVQLSVMTLFINSILLDTLSYVFVSFGSQVLSDRFFIMDFVYFFIFWSFIIFVRHIFISFVFIILAVGSIQFLRSYVLTLLVEFFLSVFLFHFVTHTALIISLEIFVF